MIGALDGAAVPDLAGEFSETLCVFWRSERARFTTAAMPDETLYKLLDALASVVLGDEPR